MKTLYSVLESIADDDHKDTMSFIIKYMKGQ